jgi:hypothetical protein
MDHMKFSFWCNPMEKYLTSHSRKAKNIDHGLAYRPALPRLMISTHASIFIDSVGPPSAEICRTAASFS